MKYERNIPLGESGIIYVCPPAPPKEKIDGYNLPKKDQKFRRQKFLSDSEFLLLDKEKRIEILSTELDRRLNGYFLMINGCLTYLTGSHYFYLNYWDMGAQTEDGFPEYRWSNTKWFYFKDFCIKDPNCFGGIMLTQKRFGKALDLETLIPTKDGWKKMIDIEIGDVVFGSDGLPTNVTFASEIQYERNCYELIFSDGTKIIADADHKWIASNAKDRASTSWLQSKNTGKVYPEVVVTTLDMLNSLKSKQGYSNWAIKNCLEVKYDKKDLKIPPYILGVWLGDGNSRQAKITSVDEEIIQSWTEYGKSIGLHCVVYESDKISYALSGGRRGGKNKNQLLEALRHYSLLENKHIPEDYLLSSIEDRIELLRGLFDTDGCKMKQAQSFEYCSKLYRLASDVRNLAESLGLKCTLTEKINKKYNKTYYYVRFGSYKINPFKLSRKSNLFGSSSRTNTTLDYRYILDIKKVDSRPVKCIQVDNKNHTYLCSKSYIVTHNTEIEIADLYNAATLIDTKCLFGMQSINATDARKNLFQDRLMRSHKAIPNYLKPISNETKSTKPIVSELTFFGNKEGGKYTAALDNKIDWRPTTVSAYQGKKPKRIFIDEPGTIDEMDLEEAWTTIREQLALGKKINGKAFLPTTLENMTNKGAFAFKEIWDKSDYNKRDENGRTASGFYRYFKPFYEGYEGFIDEYGNDLVDEAKKFRQNKLDAASEADQRKTKRQYPETQNEAFDVMTSTFFANRVVEKYKVIWDEIKNNKEDRASIVIIGDKIELKPNDKSPFVFLELPKPNVDYYLLVDGVGTGTESGGEEGSDVAGIIVKMYDPATGLPFEFVAYFRKRPQTVEQSYEYLLDLCKYYNIHGRFKKIQAEASNSTADHLPDFLRRNNLIQWAMRRRDYSGKGYVEVDKYFQPVNQWSMSYALREMNMLLDKYPNSVRMKGIVSDFLLPSDKNADLRSAALMLPFVLPPNFDKPQQQIQPIIRRRYEIVNKNGTNVRVVTSKVYYPKGYIPPVQE